MTIKREGGGPGAEHKPVWSLTLQMNLQPLGPMRVQLRLEGKALATLIWAERQGTMQLLEQHLPELQQAFEQADLEVVRLQVYQAKITQPETIPQVEGLLREKA
jgi:flagellar hook-length control protein FliK